MDSTLPVVPPVFDEDRSTDSVGVSMRMDDESRYADQPIERGSTACPMCGFRISFDAVVLTPPHSLHPEPQLMYDAKVAAALIPYQPYKAFLAWLQRHKNQFPPRYRTLYFGCRARSTRVRVISTGEVWRIREMVLRGPGKMTQ